MRVGFGVLGFVAVIFSCLMPVESGPWSLSKYMAKYKCENSLKSVIFSSLQKYREANSSIYSSSPEVGFQLSEIIDIH